ncbi:hypothetical protein FSP39_009662 [Pinctada imbricata]|uniref:PHD-type domain-containing protein n=1 Tax=Pinctada imbricata TaxID=66713 RepID=A0AA88YUX9_PINIB|nr:hypothetical protein FSP39_009662 [Pinctada imbricata]
MNTRFIVSLYLLISVFVNKTHDIDDLNANHDMPNSNANTNLRFANKKSFCDSLTHTIYIVRDIVCKYWKPEKEVSLYLSVILLANSYAPEPNPGPRTPKYPCGTCGKAVTWKTAGVCCDSCDRWHHKECIGVNTLIYQGLRNISWECDQCGLPNFSSCLFDTTVFLTTNPFDTLNETSLNDIHIGSPAATSSPVHSRKTSENQQQQQQHKRTDRPLRIIIMNCQSIKNKKHDLSNLVESTKPDIIIGNESWLHKDIQSAEVFPEGFTCYRNDRTSDPHGGVFILIADQYLSSEPIDLKTDDISEQLWVKVQIIGSPDLYIGSFYKPPRQTDEEYLKYLDTNIQRIRNSENAHVWLGGDFNLGGIEWDNYTIKTKAQNTRQCKQLIDICHNNYLEQVVNRPTHITDTSKSTLDLFFTSNSSLINKVEIIPGISDHEIVYVESSIKPRKIKKPPRKIYLYAKANSDKIKEEFNNIDLKNSTMIKIYR